MKCKLKQQNVISSTMKLRNVKKYGGDEKTLRLSLIHHWWKGNHNLPKKQYSNAYTRAFNF